MVNLKSLAKTLTIDEFNKRFTKENQGYSDNITGKVIFCPSDLGFKFSQSDCLVSGKCEECWNEAKECLRLMEG